jgi:hypothetical protein
VPQCSRVRVRAGVRCGEWPLGSTVCRLVGMPGRWSMRMCNTVCGQEDGVSSD